MTKAEMLDVVFRTRALLEVSYIPYKLTDGAGGRCHWGCLNLIQQGHELAWLLDDPALAYLDKVAVRLYPESELYSFPSVFVNNKLGKEAILAVYDAAIAQLQVAVLCEEEAEKREEVLA